MQNEESKAQRKKQRKQEQSDSVIQEELLKYLAENEKIIKSKTEAEKELEIIKEENNKFLASLKGKSTEELFDLVMKEIKDTIKEENLASESEVKITLTNENIKTYYTNSQAVDRQYEDLDKFNKSVLQKIKQITEDKVKLVEIEENKTKEIAEQCEKFKAEYIEKFNSASVETIKKDNVELERKLNECRESTKKIQESIDAQHDLRDNKKMDLESLFTSHLTEKLDSLKKQSNEYKTENKKLHETLDELE